MANEVLQKAGTQLSFADHAGDFSPANSLEQGGHTDVQFSLAALTAGEYRQSTKADLTATRALQFSVMAQIEWSVAPTAGGTVNFWWGPTPDSAAPSPGGLGESDADYHGYGADDASAAEAVAQLQYIGALVATADATIQTAFVGTFSAPERYGILVATNGSDQTLNADDVEMHVVIDPIVDEIQ
jgi:hypothetical protein